MKALIPFVIAILPLCAAQTAKSSAPIVILGGASKAVASDFKTAFALTAECKGVAIGAYTDLRSGKLDYWALDVFRNEVVQRNREALASLGMKPDPHDDLYVWSIIHSVNSGYSSKLDGGAKTLRDAARQTCIVVKRRGGSVR